MKKMNKKGFTLVELLAVIVVLAIVMLIGVQAVFPQIEKARRQTMAIEAQSIIEAAQTYLMSNSVSGTGTTLPAKTGDLQCVSIQKLISDGQFAPKDGTYTGAVKVKKVAANKYVYKIWLNKNNTWMIINAGANSAGTDNVKITEADVVDYVINNNTKTSNHTSASNKDGKWGTNSSIASTDTNSETNICNSFTW